ncbi:putative lipoprotein LprB [Nocardia sp. RB20]|uniref:Putative lipoprotein LprB n=2 Tax=Nocardia macrotermitis TaxID=2585198 RepID=A0A7K0D1U4_9NOCA|nr:putative lipoprotein LprB [Nocardia macrotermitis]
MTSAIVTGTAIAALLTACGSGGDSNDNPSVRPPMKVAALGPFVGECGGVTDDEVRDIGGLGQISATYKNSVGCNWQASGIGGASVTFASYRGSPLGRERAWVTAQGRNPETIDVGGHSGFQDATANGDICDLAVQLGDDFFEWSTSSGLFSSGNADPCAKNRKLAELTVQRLK